MKKLLAILLSLITCFATTLCVTACGGGGSDSEDVDASKTQFYLGVYDGGLGTDWANKVKAEFEAKYADVEFEPGTGKRGVQVLIRPDKLGYEPDTLISNIQSGVETCDVYLTANNQYYKFVQNGVAEDITELLTEKVYDENGELSDNGTVSLLDRTDDYFVDTFKWKDGKYYGFPFEDSLQGLIYDEDLFNERRWTVPTTMKDFYKLIARMANSSVTPFTWTGANDFYFTCLTTAIVAQYEGVNGVNAYKTYTGTLDSDNYYYDSANAANNAITERNAWKLAGNRGNLEALKFLREITKDARYYSSFAFGGSQSHLIAQQEFLSSIVKESNTGSGRIAMLLDGEWWENEARGYFGEMASIDENYGYGKRNFKFLPMPAIDGQKSDKRTVVSFSSGSIGFVSTKAARKDIAKLWIQFMHQNSQLTTFTTTTGSSLPYKYTLSDEAYASLTPFAKSVWDVKHDENVEIIRETGTCDFATFGGTRLGGLGSEISTSDATNALRAFYNDKNLTAQKYFEKSMDYCNETEWTRAYNIYHNN